MDPKEAARREHQRRKQKEAWARQAGAKKSGSGKAWREAAFKGKGRNDHKKQRQTEDTTGRRVHDIVIIPIFWRQHPGEEYAVVADADRIKAMLKADVWIDRTHKKSPGQKYAFWEDVGVRFRIELGPDDVRNKRCVVATSSGTFKSAKKRTVSSVDQAELLAALRDLGCDKAKPALNQDDVTEQSQRADANLERWAAAGGRQPASSGSGSNKRLKIDVDARRATRFDDDDDEEPPSKVRNDDELGDDEPVWAEDAASSSSE